MDKHRLLYLLNRFLNREATPEETSELERWYNELDKLPGLTPEELIPPTFPIEKTILQNDL